MHGNMKNIIRYLTCMLLLLCALGAQAQRGTEFWFAPPWMNSHHTGEADFHVVLSAYDRDAHVVISQPADGNRVLCDTVVLAHSYCDVIVAPKSDHKSYAEAQIEVPYNSISKRGMYITADHDIGAYYQITMHNGEAYTLKGQNALGTEFVVMSQNKYPNHADYNGYKSHNNSIQIVATEDGTTVTITPSQPIIHDDNTSSTAPVTLTLNRGQTYAVKAAGTAAAAHLIGTRVDADKPIAVTTSDDSVEGGGGEDAVGEQLVPTDMAGTDYTVIPLPGSTKESIFILALHPSTTVELHAEGSEEKIVLDSLQSVSRTLSKVTYIHADADIQIFQLTHREGELGGTVLPQMLCTGSNHVTYKRIPNSTYTVLNILTQTDNAAYLYMNGNEVPQADFRPIPGTDGKWSYISLNVTAKPAAMPLEIESKRGVFQLGVVDFASDPTKTLTYGFFSDYANGAAIDVVVDEELLDTAFVLCEGDSVTMVAAAPDGVSNFKWYRGNTLVHTSDTLTIEAADVAKSGTYRVEGDSHDCTVEYKEFTFFIQPRQTVIPLTEVIIAEGESYTWPVNGQTYSTSTYDTVWTAVQYGDLPVFGCDTAEALHVIVRACIEATLTCPDEICGDEATILLPFTITGSGEYTVAAAFDAKAKAAGFTDGELTASGSDLVLPVPEAVYADTYTAVVTFTPTEDGCEIQQFPISFLVRYPNTVFTQRWNDVLAVYNERYNRGEGRVGYKFTSYQWYKNGQPITGATGSYYYVGPVEQLDFNADYSVELKREDGVVMRSCEYRPVQTDAPDMVTTTKSLIRGQIIIRRGDKEYTPLGLPLR